MAFARLVAYPFIGWAAVVVVLTGVGLFITFPVGRFAGAAAARRFFLTFLAVAAVLFVAVVLWGVVSGQLAGAVAEFGWAPLFEMGMFGLVYLFVMGFPFLRMIQEATALSKSDRGEQRHA